MRFRTKSLNVIKKINKYLLVLKGYKSSNALNFSTIYHYYKIENTNKYFIY